MIGAVIVVSFILGTMLTLSMARVAGDADKKHGELFQAYLLGEEKQDGNRQKEIQQTA